MGTPTILQVFQFISVVLMAAFLPCTAIAYWRFGHPVRERETRRVFERLQLPFEDLDRYGETPGALALASGFSLLTFVGLSLIAVMGDEFRPIPFGESGQFPIAGSQLIFGLAGLGGYIWGAYDIFTRYTVNDLTPKVYYRLSVRMIFAAVVAVITFNSSELLFDIQTDAVWIPIAFVIGMFPQRALHSIGNKLPAFFPAADAAAGALPLELIPGIEIHDRIRLEEEGIYNCHGLANYDFVPLMLKTPYSARQLVDWILQARLCEYVGEAVKDLRELGIRRITDLKGRRDVAELAKETTSTESSLREAQRWVRENEDSLRRLLAAGEQASRFLTDEGQNVTLVKQFYGALKAGNSKILSENCSENATLVYPSVDGVSYSQSQDGKAMRDFLMALAVEEEILNFTQDDFIAQSDKVVVTGHYKSRIRTTGRSLDAAYVHIFTIDGGNIDNLAVYFNYTASMARGKSAP